jgi:hypothetical protein
VADRVFSTYVELRQEIGLVMLGGGGLAVLVGRGGEHGE